MRDGEESGYQHRYDSEAGQGGGAGATAHTSRRPLGLERRILVVDDDENVCKLLDRQLTDAGYRVVYATNATDAIARFHERPSPVVLTDYLLPPRGPSREASFLDMLGELHTINPAVSVYVMSGALPDSAALQDLGVVECIQKPWDKAYLQQRIARHYDK